MDTLDPRHLTTLTLTVDYPNMVDIGTTAHGRRRVAPVTAGSFAGERLRGNHAVGADWVINRSDGVMVLDVRLTLTTHDGASIYLTYAGSFVAATEHMAAFNKGARLDFDQYRLRTVPRFETGDARYAWLNDLPCAGVGRQTATGPVYTIWEI